MWRNSLSRADQRGPLDKTFLAKFAFDGKMVLLRSDKLTLRPVDEPDMKDLFRWFNDPVTVGEYDVPFLVDWFTFEKYTKEGSNSPWRFTTLVIERNSDRAKLGIIAYYYPHPITKNYEIGFEISDPKERGKGYASESLLLVLEFLFLTQAIERIQARADARNSASIRVLEKCGFQKEGTLRKFFFIGGEYRDSVLYSILREEWMKMHQNGSLPKVP